MVSKHDPDQDSIVYSGDDRVAGAGGFGVDSNATRASELILREAHAADLDAVVEIDRQASGARKSRYWLETLKDYQNHAESTFFLVAEWEGRVVGFVIGEIRAWEFGSPPCGWVYAIGVQRGNQLTGVGTNLMDALCARFRRAGVGKVRTMIERRDHELLSFFRSYNMMAGPFLQLELDLANVARMAASDKGKDP